MNNLNEEHFMVLEQIHEIAKFWVNLKGGAVPPKSKKDWQTVFELTKNYQPIIITVERGVVQNIEGFLPKQKVIVKDYDTDGASENDDNLEIDENGDSYFHLEFN